jgi:serine/threonine protein kinase/tetratricopeptide (TPR) repeat protein
MIGQLLGHYRIIEKIGAGGMGEVYRAHDESLERDVALKVLPAGLLADEAARKRFRKEALALAKLNHPYIETIYEFATQDGVDFLAMELIAGLTLGQKMTAGLLSDQETLRLGTQIAEGLNAAHEQGVVHCDLKPGNVMVTSNGHAKVLDFGLAKFFHTSKDSSITESLTEVRAAGTLPYMSPEQVRGERVDSRTDIYSAGAVLYEMSTGQRPFPETHGPRLIDAILHQLPLPPSTHNHKVKPAFESVILKALDKDPERRYQSAKELSVDLKRLMVSAPLTSPLLVSPPRRHMMRRFRLSIMISVSLAVVLVLVFLGVKPLFIRRNAEAVPRLGSGKRLAVLPLLRLGDDQANFAYIADGFAEGLTTKLSVLRELYVSSSHESERSKYTDSFPKIAQSLGVNFVARGILQGSGNQIRIVLSVEDLAHGNRLSTREFLSTKDKLQDLEDQAFEVVATGLGIKPSEEEISRSEARQTTNGRAYDLYMQGRYALVGKDSKSIQAALDYFDQALHEDPAFVLTYVGTADACIRMYGFQKDNIWTQKALSAALAAEQLDDGLPEVHSVLGGIYVAKGKHAEAITELKRAIALAPSSDEAYRRLGAAYLASGNYPHAIEAFQKAVGLNSYFWLNHNALGNAYFQSGDFAKASQSFKQITVLAPDIEAAYENIGGIFLQRGMYQESIPFFQKALQIEPDFSTYSNLGTSYFFLKQYPNAIEMFEKAVALNPNDTDLMVNLADAYRGAGQQDKARATYEQAIAVGFKELQTNPQNADVMSEIALSYAKIGKAPEAQKLIRQARGIDKSSVSYIYAEAQIDALLGRSSESLKLLREALEKHFPAEAAATDSDLDSLHSSPEFNDLIKKYSAKP